MTDKDKQYPSLKKQFQNASGLAKRVLVSVLSNHEILTSKEEKKRRQKICNSCDQKDWEWGRCKACGCFLLAKFQAAAADCPLNKWDIDEDTLRKAYEEELDKRKDEE